MYKYTIAVVIKHSLLHTVAHRSGHHEMRLSALDDLYLSCCRGFFGGIGFGFLVGSVPGREVSSEADFARIDKMNQLASKEACVLIDCRYSSNQNSS